MREIRVYPNPYHAIDGRGEPQCAVPYPGTLDRYIGARIDHEKSLGFARDRLSESGLDPKRDFDERTGVPALFKYFVDEKGLAPVAIPYSAEISGYVARQINDGALIAADAETARMVGISTFEDPVKRLEVEKLEACHYVLATKCVRPEAILKEGCDHKLAPAWAKVGLEYFLPAKPFEVAPVEPAPAAPVEAPAEEHVTLTNMLQARVSDAGKDDV